MDVIACARVMISQFALIGQYVVENQAQARGRCTPIGCGY